MNLISPVHLLFIAAFALIFIGPRRLPEVARSIGTGMRVFRDALNGDLRRGALDDAGGKGDGESVAPAPAGPYA
jgi:TatA/E family protein of Tat protein translocase